MQQNAAISRDLPPTLNDNYYVNDPSKMGGRRFDDSKVEHKFFTYDLDLDLEKVTKNLQVEYERIRNAEMRGVAPFNRENPNSEFFKESNSISTIKSREYNVFQMYYPWAHDLFSAVTAMTREACAYYGVEYNDYRWLAQSWFNINSKEKGGKLHFHDHVRKDYGDLAFHGYFSVSAEPSETHYDLLDGKVKINHNINNRAILSKVGYPHAMNEWDFEGPRITIAYDVIPLHTLEQEAFLAMQAKDGITDPLWEQHYNPLPRDFK